MSVEKAIQIMKAYAYELEETGYDNSYYVSNYCKSKSIINKYMTEEDIINFVTNFLI